LWLTDSLTDVKGVYYAGIPGSRFGRQAYSIELLLKSGETRSTGIRPLGLTKARAEALRWHELIFGRNTNNKKSASYRPPLAEILHKPGTPHGDFIKENDD
jgi:hypothetical protein